MEINRELYRKIIQYINNNDKSKSLICNIEVLEVIDILSSCPNLKFSRKKKAREKELEKMIESKCLNKLVEDTKEILEEEKEELFNKKLTQRARLMLDLIDQENQSDLYACFKIIENIVKKLGISYEDFDIVESLESCIIDEVIELLAKRKEIVICL